MIETTHSPTIKFPPRLSWQNPAANRIARSDRRLPNTLAIVFARRSLVVYIVLEIFCLGLCFQSLFSFEEKLLFLSSDFFVKKENGEVRRPAGDEIQC